jgi:hypothetical protein
MKWIVAALAENRVQAQFTETGMEGVQRKSPMRPVSLMSLAARQEVDQADLRGGCVMHASRPISRWMATRCQIRAPSSARMICSLASSQRENGAGRSANYFKISSPAR